MTARLRTLIRELTLIAVLGTSMAGAASAQEAEQGQLVRIYEMILRPEAVQEWHRMQREEAIPALLEGGYPWVDVWRSGGAGNVFYRSILLPLNNLDELDETAVFTRALGAEGAEDLLERHRALVTSINTRIVRTRPDLGFGDPSINPDVGVLTTVVVAPGRTEDFEELMQKSVVRELQLSNVASLRVGEVLFGGAGHQYFALFDFPQRGDRPTAPSHPTPLEWAMGPVALARIAESPNSPIVSIDRTILTYDRTLSSGNRSAE